MKKITCLFIALTLVCGLSAKSNPSSEQDGAHALVDATSALLSSFDGDKKVEKGVKSLLSGIDAEDALSAVSALQSLSSLDFSKDQLSQYGSLLVQVVPVILSSSFDLENGELGQYVGKAIKFMQSEEFVAASDLIGKALELVDSDSLQEDVLNGLIKSYAPMLEGIDVEQVVGLGKSLLSSSPAQ